MYRSLLIASLIALSFSSQVQAAKRKPLAPAACKGQSCGAFTMTDEQLNQDLALLEKMVNTPSETNDIEGVNFVSAMTNDELIKLGFKTKFIQNPNLDPATQKPIAADLLVGEIAGKKANQFITFIVHADTVFKKGEDGKVPVPFQIVDSVKMPLQIEIPGKRILGSGVGDNKGGIVVMLRAIKLLLSKGTPEYSLRAIVSTNEEVGSPGHKVAMASFAKDSVAVLGLEPSSQGNILTGRGGVHWYEVTVTGVEAHAGVAHEKGVNACLDLSIKLVKASELTDYANNITVNIGTIAGGKRANIVCGEAKAVIDTRFPSVLSDQALEAKLTEILMKPEVTSKNGQNLTTTTTIKTTSQSTAFEMTPVSTPYLNHILKQIKDIDGLNAVPKYSRGGADISVFNAPDAIMLDGLGPVTDASHTALEYIVLDTMRSRALILADLVTQIK